MLSPSVSPVPSAASGMLSLSESVSSASDRPSLSVSLVLDSLASGMPSLSASPVPSSASGVPSPSESGSLASGTLSPSVSAVPSVASGMLSPSESGSVASGMPSLSASPVPSSASMMPSPSESGFHHGHATRGLRHPEWRARRRAHVARRVAHHDPRHRPDVLSAADGVPSCGSCGPLVWRDQVLDAGQPHSRRKGGAIRRPVAGGPAIDERGRLLPRHAAAIKDRRVGRDTLSVPVYSHVLRRPAQPGETAT
mmetsp:Transcript_5043/g.16836  ORF Transcript_5043/g.16836 Transcript_5043/m.16836 type:complete len:253 (-) Transcript_5043:225-983(-)